MSGTINVVGMPEFDGLLDYIHEHGTEAEGVIERANAFARAVIAQYAPVRVKPLSEFMAEQEALHPGIRDKMQAAEDELRAEIERLRGNVRPRREDECLTLDHWRMRAYDLERNWARCSHACAVEQAKREQAEALAERLRAEVERLNRILGRIVEGDGDSTLVIRMGADAFAAAREYLLRDQEE